MLSSGAVLTGRAIQSWKQPVLNLVWRSAHCGPAAWKLQNTHSSRLDNKTVPWRKTKKCTWLICYKVRTSKTLFLQVDQTLLKWKKIRRRICNLTGEISLNKNTNICSLFKLRLCQTKATLKVLVISTQVVYASWDVTVLLGIFHMLHLLRLSSI